MIISKKRKPIKKVEIDLTGPEGNAFVLMTKAINFSKQLKFSKEKIQDMLDDMRSGDYENLLKVFERHFGDYVILYR